MAQKTNVSTEFVKNIFIDDGGKIIMEQVLDIIEKSCNGKTIEEISNSFEMPIDFFISEIFVYMKKNINLYNFMKEEDRPTRSRSESSFTPTIYIDIFKINSLWSGVKERFNHFDIDGSTCWSEAPAEAVFSILDYIVNHKRSLTFEHMIQLCRVIREGPSPGTIKAQNLTKLALSKWPFQKSTGNVRFATSNFIHGITSNDVSNAMNK